MTISQWSLIGMVLGTGALVAIAALITVGILLALLDHTDIEVALAIGVILAATTVARLLLDLRRLLRARARRRRVPARESGDEDEDEDEDA